jgi:hypothetical protein
MELGAPSRLDPGDVLAKVLFEAIHLADLIQDKARMSRAS